MLSFRIKEKYKIKHNIVVIYKSFNDYYVQGMDCIILNELCAVKFEYNSNIQDIEAKFSKSTCDSCRTSLCKNEISNMLLEVNMTVYHNDKYSQFEKKELAPGKNSIDTNDDQRNIKVSDNGHMKAYSQKNIEVIDNVIPNHVLHSDQTVEKQIASTTVMNYDDEELISRIPTKECRNCLLSFRGDCNGFNVCDDYKEKYNTSFEERSTWPTSSEMRRSILKGFRDK